MIKHVRIYCLICVAYTFSLYIIYSQNSSLDINKELSNIKLNIPVGRIDPKLILPNKQDEIYLQKLDSIWSSKFKKFNIFSNVTLSNENKIIEVSDKVLKERMSILDLKSPMDLSYNPVVRGYIDRYLNSGDWFSKTRGLAQYYFPLFEEILDKYNIPLEIKYLAIVESALKPRATSRMGAKGLWQFMYQTGKLYNLNNNSYIDQRFDPILSTEAACQFLADLYDMFEDWNLVLAAYNSGPGNVMKAIRRSGGKKNYWNIRSFLPHETQGYVPAFVAVNYVMEYAKEHNLPILPPVSSIYATDTIRLVNMVSFDQLSKFLHIPISLIEFLNPQFKRNIIPATLNQPQYIRLPNQAIYLLTNNEVGFYSAVKQDFVASKEQPNASVLLAHSKRKKYKSNKSRLIYHLIKKGESIGEIAEYYGVSISRLRRWNRLKSNTIIAGKKLKVFSSKRNIYKKYHKVRRGESLIRIAKMYRTRVLKLKRLNNLNSSKIKIGQRLKIR